MNFFHGKDKEKETLVEQTILKKYNQYYRLAYSYVHNEADAGDIVQNAAYKDLRSSSKLEEIAIILEENVNTVKSRLYHSMKKLRMRLEE